MAQIYPKYYFFSEIAPLSTQIKMRKAPILALFLLSFLTVYTAKAQQFNAGFRLGANFCQIDGDHMVGYNQGGLVGGVFVSYPFSDRWEGQFEMLFSQKGSSRLLTDSIQQAGPWDVLQINYIEVPVMMNYKLTPRLKLSMGLGGALMIGNHFVGLKNDVRDNVDFVTRGEFSGTVGAQYYFSPRFSLFGRFTYSLIGINKPNSAVSAATNALGYYVYDGGMANNVISFGLYFSFLKNKFPEKKKAKQG